MREYALPYCMFFENRTMAKAWRKKEAGAAERALARLLAKPTHTGRDAADINLESVSGLHDAVRK